MNILQEIEQLLARATRAEKAQVLQWIVRDLGDAFPGIESTQNVCGGEPCIVRTRIPVWVLVQARRLGGERGGFIAELSSSALRRFGERLGLLPPASRRD